MMLVNFHGCSYEVLCQFCARGPSISNTVFGPISEKKSSLISEVGSKPCKETNVLSCSLSMDI